jgi:hypothetical protein
MKMFNSILRNTRGLSLIEILIALLLTGIVTAAIFKVYINQHKNWVVQGEITNMQQNARAAIDELTREARMAGHELPPGLPCIEAYDTNPDTIVIKYTSGGCYAPIVHSMPMPSSELRCDGYDVSCFQDGQMAYIYHPDSGGGEFFEISLVQSGSQHIQHNDWPLSKCYDKDAIIVSLEQVKFYIDNTTNPDQPALMMQIVGQPPAIYAENIEDLQFRYRMKNGGVIDVPIIAEDIREVLMSLTARIEKPDPDFPDDPYRRRMYSSRVNLRNI